MSTEQNLGQPLDVHVVVLANYVAPHNVASLQELEKRVRKLTLLLSVPMEPDRQWEPQWAELDVRVQKSWMFKTKWKHSTGFSEDNFIHIPIDTISQLKSLKPDIVFSYEMGIRTLLSGWYRRFHPKVPLVLIGNMSEHIERERGVMRRALRWIIRQRVDYFTYNGPSCKRYFESLSIPGAKLFHLPYCIDSAVVFTGDLAVPSTTGNGARRLIYCGALRERKGIFHLAQSLQQWCSDNPEQGVEFSLAGSGELQSAIALCATDNLSIKFLGHCNAREVRTAYGNADICVFPTLADEWGLVPIEALASGLPVLGSVYAQSVETEVKAGETGWIFDPLDDASMYDGIDQAMKCLPTELVAMGLRGRESVAHISALATCEKFLEIISTVLPASGGFSSTNLRDTR